MSACICIMNQHAVALAADSAVTIGGGVAIHNSVNKLFSLSRKEPIGALIYADANFMNVPVEIILKQYRKYIDQSGEYFDTLQEYIDSFFDFLVKNDELFRFSINEKSFVYSVVEDFFAGLDETVKQMYRNKVEEKGRELTDAEYKLFYKEVVKNNKKFAEQFDELEDFDVNTYLVCKYWEEIYTFVADKYKEFDDEDIEILTDVAIGMVSKDFWRSGYVGIAIAGYGKKEIYPSMVHLHLSGFVNGKLKVRIVKKDVISEKNNYSITPLAQVDVMETFLYGLNNNFLRYIQGIIPKTLDDDIDKLPAGLFSSPTGKEAVKKELEICTAHIVNEIVNEAHKNYFNPIRKSIGSLPIEEMSVMAESMINLTSLRRQIAIDNISRTVGGPIDVAVISKTEGFIWIKRKHYFDGNLNPQYYYNNFGGVDNGTKD